MDNWFGRGLGRSGTEQTLDVGVDLPPGGVHRSALGIDGVIVRCPDELFELPALAAMKRGDTDQKHRTKENGQYFFAGEVRNQDNGAHECDNVEAATLE